jgi:hypothetical protein
MKNSSFEKTVAFKAKKSKPHYQPDEIPLSVRDDANAKNPTTNRNKPS